VARVNLVECRKCRIKRVYVGSIRHRREKIGKNTGRVSPGQREFSRKACGDGTLKRNFVRCAKGVVRVEPAMIGVTALVRSAELNHGNPSAD
jgi:hypothetical protein